MYKVHDVFLATSSFLFSRSGSRMLFCFTPHTHQHITATASPLPATKLRVAHMYVSITSHKVCALRRLCGLGGSNFSPGVRCGTPSCSCFFFFVCLSGRRVRKVVLHIASSWRHGAASVPAGERAVVGSVRSAGGGTQISVSTYLCTYDIYVGATIFIWYNSTYCCGDCRATHCCCSASFLLRVHEQMLGLCGV